MPEKLMPFQIETRLAGRDSLIVFAVVDGKRTAQQKYSIGNGEKRLKVASAWSKDKRLCDGEAIDPETVAVALEEAEIQAIADVDELLEQESTESAGLIERASFVDDRTIAELAWNMRLSRADFIVLDRGTGKVTRAERVDTASGTIIPPSICAGIVTPGPNIDGAVIIPSEVDEKGQDEDRLRESILSFMGRYVEFPGETTAIVVEYVLMTWLYDAFDELPYVGFKTADPGRGKSRALEVIGQLCYRPLFVGGGSSAAATLRMLDMFQGTMVSDECDSSKGSELGSDIARILNQGFQRNRPLIKCDGQDNAPRAFKCFGPKVFALRKQLGDDATESRTIFIKMAQRTRKSIPINLPRKAFDREALVLRNQLLAWRFANLGKIKLDPSLADPNLEDRSNQIGLPLLTIARSDSARSAIVSALRDQQASVAEQRSETGRGEVFAALIDLLDRGDLQLGGSVRPREVATEVNRRRAIGSGVETDKLRHTLNSQKAGYLIRSELELPSLGKDRNGAKYRLDPTRMKQLAARFGLDLPGSSQGTVTGIVTRIEPANQCQELPCEDSRTACDDRDDRDVLQGCPGEVREDAQIEAESDLRTRLKIPGEWDPLAWATELERRAGGMGDAQACRAQFLSQAAEIRKTFSDDKGLASVG